MSTQEESHESTYISSTESDAEATRLLHQDQAITRTTGLLPSSLTLHPDERILDVACGPAGWTRALASTYPAVQVLGVDISQTMLAYANAAQAKEPLPNLSFQLMDITRPWSLADASFEVVHARLLVGFLSGEKWPQVLAEMRRVLVPGGTIILTETDDGGHTNSPAFETLTLHAYRSARRAGLTHHPLGHHFGITPLLGSYLQQAGIAEIQQEAHAIDFSAGMPAHQALVENAKAVHKLVQPYIVRQGVATQPELDTLYAQLLEEIESPDFRALWYFLRIWGSKPVG